MFHRSSPLLAFGERLSPERPSRHRNPGRMAACHRDEPASGSSALRSFSRALQLDAPLDAGWDPPGIEQQPDDAGVAAAGCPYKGRSTVRDRGRIGGDAGFQQHLGDIRRQIHGPSARRFQHRRFLQRGWRRLYECPRGGRRPNRRSVGRSAGVRAVGIGADLEQGFHDRDLVSEAPSREDQLSSLADGAQPSRTNCRTVGSSIRIHRVARARSSISCSSSFSPSGAPM